MNIPKGFLLMMAVFLLIVANLSLLGAPTIRVRAEAMGTLSGTIFDVGVDSNFDGAFDVLQVGIELNVSTAGLVYVEVAGLYDATYQYVNVWGSAYHNVSLGAQVVLVLLDGPTIYASGRDPARVASIYLYDEYHYLLDDEHDVPLSRTYAYTEFGLPPASLTGTILDEGVDTDFDGAFNVLKVQVEVNVTVPGMFRVAVSGLMDSMYNYISVSDGNSAYLDMGLHELSVSLDGPAIYMSELDPSMVYSIDLHDEYYNPLDTAYNVPLSRTYAYTEFDAPPAHLTRAVYDRGVDRDGDGAFDYLEVGVEVNVTDAGGYRVEVWGLLDSSHNFISVGNHTSANLAAGLHVLNVTLRGLTICAALVSPTNVSQITLYSVELVPPDEHLGDWLGTVHNAPLSREYSYTEFDAPFRDMDVTFVVCPDGRIIMDGALNYMDMEPSYSGPSIEGTATVQTSNNVTDIAATFTLTIPSDEASQFPFNASTLSLLADYADDLLTTSISGSTVLPSSIASQLPFNITDFTVLATYGDGLVTGNITVDMWTGFPLDDLVVDFQGNHTYVHLSGSTSVIFGDYASFGEVNASVLEHLLAELTNTLGGQGPDSLYNATYGLLELTMLQNVTTLYGGYATVEFEAKLEGDLIQTLVTMTGDTPYDSPAMSDTLHAVWASVDSGSLVLTYTHTLKQADFSLLFVANVTRLIDHLIPILPDILPPDGVVFVESMLNTTYCTVDTGQISVTYEDGQALITATASIHDLNAELDYLKYLLLDYAMPSPWPPAAYTLNEMQLALTDLAVHVNLTDTALLIDVEGVAVHVPFHWINATNFTLEHFFNVTAGDQEPPGANEQLTVMVVGGSNATHTVTIVCPDTMPDPDVSLPSAVTWDNQSISQLTGLMFQLGPRDTTPPTIDPCVQTPMTPDFGEAVTVAANVTDTDTGVRSDGVILIYRVNGGAWTNVTMSHTTSDTYEGVIPALPGGTHVEYMVVAYDYADNPAVDDAAGLYYVYTVIPEFPTWSILAAAVLLSGLVLVVMKRRRTEKS